MTYRVSVCLMTLWELQTVFWSVFSLMCRCLRWATANTGSSTKVSSLLNLNRILWLLRGSTRGMGASSKPKSKLENIPSGTDDTCISFLVCILYPQLCQSHHQWRHSCWDPVSFNDWISWGFAANLISHHWDLFTSSWCSLMKGREWWRARMTANDWMWDQRSSGVTVFILVCDRAGSLMIFDSVAVAFCCFFLFVVRTKHEACLSLKKKPHTHTYTCSGLCLFHNTCTVTLRCLQETPSLLLWCFPPKALRG